MLRVLLAATLLSSTASFAQQGTCYRDYAGNTHCQGDDGSSGSAYTDPIGTTHYQSSNGTTGSSYVDPNGALRYQFNNSNPGVSAQSQYELQRQLESNRRLPRNDGATRLGEVLGGAQQSRDAAYANGVLQGMERRVREEEAKADEMERQGRIRDAQDRAHALELETKWQGQLAKAWVAYGASAEEAESVSKLFKFDYNSQIPIFEHVKSEGWRVAVADAKAAYKAYNYQLANQILVAAMIASQQQGDAPSK